MIFYKFRSLQNIEFVLDIIFNERLHCALYSNLNDPFEGLFHTITKPTNNFLSSLIKEIKTCKTIEDLYFEVEKSKICSLTKSLHDVRLWSHYADGHKGIAIEIDFSENEKNIYKVKYVPSIQEFELGKTFLGSLAINPLPTHVLSFKTEHWSYEDEYRIIQSENYYSISGRIKSIYTGHRISNFHLDLLKKLVPSQIPIITTNINTKDIIVQPNMNSA